MQLKWEVSMCGFNLLQSVTLLPHSEGVEGYECLVSDERAPRTWAYEKLEAPSRSILSSAPSQWICQVAKSGSSGHFSVPHETEIGHKL